MVGRCKCGSFKFNLHNTCLTEIPWLCFSCRDLHNNIRPIVTRVARQVHRAPSTIPKQKPPIVFSIKRVLEMA